MEQARGLLEQAISITAKMVELARGGEWGALEQLSVSRQSLLAHYSAGPGEDARLAELKALDDSLLTLARDRHRELEIALKRQKKTGAGLRAYQETDLSHAGHGR